MWWIVLGTALGVFQRDWGPVSNLIASDNMVARYLVAGLMGAVIYGVPMWYFVKSISGY